MISERYRIDEILAMGGMGAVYRGEHVRMRKRVAIKVLHPETENLPELAARFEREAIAGAHLEHPNVAAATDFGRLEDGSYFLVLEFVRGMTLHELIKAGPIPSARAVSIARQIASALGAAHGLGIVHRDVKPRNVMLVQPSKDRDRVKLIDFGLAKVPLDRISTVPHGEELAESRFVTGIGVVFGTVAYMAPETALGMEAVNERSDLYALGIILYEMLAGAHPFDAIDPGALFLQQRTALPPPIHERGPGVFVPSALEAVVMRLLKKDPGSRFPDADALIAALDAASVGLDPAGAVPEPTDGRLSVAGAIPPSLPPPPAPKPAAGLPHRQPSSPLHAPHGSAMAAVEPTAPELSVRPHLPSAPPSRASYSPAPAPSAEPPPPVGYVPRLVGTAAPDGVRTYGGWRLGAFAAAAFVAALVLGSALLGGRDGQRSAVAARGLRRMLERPAPDVTVRYEGQTAAEWRARIIAAAQAKQWVKGAGALKPLAELDPTQFHDRETAAAAAAIAAGLELTDAPEADDIFEILSTRLGADGLDILYDIVAVRGGSKGALRAAELLRKPAVAVRASPALRIALLLRDAPCKDKPALFNGAAAEGDGRALAALELLRGPSCLPKTGQCCFQKSAALDRAITALRSRPKR